MFAGVAAGRDVVATMNVETIVGALRGVKIASTNEADLQDGIAVSLATAGIDFKREHRLSKSDRVDFMVGSIGVEIKIQDSVSALTRQLQRYALSDEVSELLVITTRSRLSNLPRVLNGKPVRCHVFMVAFA